MTNTDQKYVVALELSGTAVRAAAAKVGDDGAPVKILAIETAASEGCIQYGRVQNLIEAAKHTSYVIRKLENNPALAHGKITSVFVALAGRTLATVKTTAQIALPTEMEMTEELLRRLYQEATKSVPADRTVLKVLPRKFIVDNHTVSNPVGAMGSKIKGEFTVVLCSPVNRRNLEMVMDERLTLPVNGYILTPLAEAKMALTEEEKQLGCVLVDFGAHTTTMSIYKDRSLQNIVTLPLGSNNITLDISAGLSLTRERAEHSKCTLGAAVNEPSTAPDTARLNNFVQARLGEIVANVMAQIGFAGYKTADLPGGMIITGGGSKLRSFVRFIEQQTKMKVRRASIPASIAVDSQAASDPALLPIVSIVEMAAARRNAPSCIEFPDNEDLLEPDDTQAETSDYLAEDTTPASDATNDYDDDENWALDDDEAERRALERTRRTKERRQQLLKKDEERRRRREEERQLEARKINGDAPLDAEDETEKEGKQSTLERIKQAVARIFSPASIDDDTDLDDEQ